jgi:hypothetical protein
MRIKETILEELNTRDNRFALAMALNTSEASIRRYLSANEEDGELTKKTALLKIEELTGIKESKILVQSKITA